MKYLLRFSSVLAVFCLARTTAFAQCTYTTIKDGNFNDLSIYATTGVCTTPPSATSTVIINHNVVLNTDFALTGGSITINPTGSLRQDNTSRTLTIDGNNAGTQLTIEPIAERGLPQVQVGVLDLTKTIVSLGNNSTMEIVCTSFLRNHATINLNNNSLMNVLGTVDIETGNSSIFGPASGTPAGLRILGSIVGNNGGASTLFASSNTFITCVQSQLVPTGCSAAGVSTNIVTPPTSNDPSCYTVLPVTLTRFAGSRALGANAVLLNWATATEKNNAYFGVERSGDGKAFVTMAQVTGAGNSVKAQTYAYSDDAPLAGAAYYRLRQVDFDGKATYSPVVFLAAPERAADWLVATGAPRLFAVQGTLDAESRLTVLDALGRSVYSQAVTPGHADVALPALPAGVYLFRLTTQQGRHTARQMLTGN